MAGKRDGKRQRIIAKLIIAVINAIFLSLLLTAQHALAAELRDPTTPLYLAPRAQAPVELILTAIADVGSRRFAIINDRRVYQGDSVSGALIEKINEGNVVYSLKGKKYTLNMRLSIID